MSAIRSHLSVMLFGCLVAPLSSQPGQSSVAATQAPPPAREQPPGTSSLGEFSDALETLSERVMPSVVQIFATVYETDDEVDSDDPHPLATTRTSGAGVILDADGYIVTNAHLVDGAISIQVGLPARMSGPPKARSILRARGKVVGAQILAVDDETDLAVLKVEERGLPALTMGDSDDLRPGQVVLAFGSPFGLENSVTMGVVSAVARQLEPEDPMIYVQTDASINPGNSGGPLVDTEGRLVGLNTFIYSQSGGNEGIGFAAPSNIVRNVFQQVRKTGRILRGEIGVYPQTLSPSLAAGLGLSKEWGVVLADVFPHGSAEAAGLKIGDVVVSLDGKTMENGRQFQVNLYGRTIGEAVTIEVERGGQRLRLKVPVSARENDPGRLALLARPEEHLVPQLGILGLDLSPAVVALLPELRVTGGGVVVAAKVPISSPTPLPQEGELLPGDVIYAMNRQPILNLAELRAALAKVEKNKTIVLQVERDGLMMYQTFTVG